MQNAFERKYVAPHAGRVLIVGSKVYKTTEDRRVYHDDVLGVDMQDGPGVDRVVDFEETVPDDLGTFGHVECCSVLEHSRRPWLMAQNIEHVMNVGATLFLAVPFVWRVHAFPNDYWRFTLDGVRALFPRIRWETLVYGDVSLHNDRHVPLAQMDGHPYLARSEVLGFGVRT